MLLIEEKQVPIKISLVPMRSYGDKPREFLNKVPNGLLPAITVERGNGNEQTITESQVIMELLDQWHSAELGYRPMMPLKEENLSRYDKLARLEREYVTTTSAVCSLEKCYNRKPKVTSALTRFVLSFMTLRPVF